MPGKWLLSIGACALVLVTTACSSASDHKPTSANSACTQLAELPDQLRTPVIHTFAGIGSSQDQQKITAAIEQMTKIRASVPVKLRPSIDAAIKELRTLNPHEKYTDEDVKKFSAALNKLDEEVSKQCAA